MTIHDIEITGRTDGRPLTMSNPATRLFVSPNLLIIDGVEIRDPKILAQAVTYQERPEPDGWKWMRLAVDVNKAKALHRQAMLDGLFPVVPVHRRGVYYLRRPRRARGDAEAAPYRRMVAAVLGAGPLPDRARSSWWPWSDDRPDWLPLAPHTIHTDPTRQVVEQALTEADRPWAGQRTVITADGVPVHAEQRL